MAGILKKKWVRYLLILGIGGSAAAYFLLQPEAAPEYVLAKAEKGSITQTVTATGAIKAEPTIDLHFQKSGKVEDIFVEEGDRVSVNQTLASLENRALDLEIERNQANVDLATAQYNQTKAGNTTEEIRIAEADVQSAQASLEAAEKDQINTQAINEANIELAQLAYDQALDNMEAAKRDLETTTKLAEQELAKLDLEGSNTQTVALQSAYSKAKTSLDIVLTATQEALFLTEEIIGLRGAGFLELSLQERNSLRNVYYNPAKTDYENAIDLQGMLLSDSSNEAIDKAISATIKAGNSALVLLSQTGEALRDINIRSPEQEEYNMQISSASSKVSTATLSLSELQTSILNIKTGGPQDSETAALNYQLQIDAAENAYNTAVNNFEKAKFDLEQSKINAENSNKNAEAQVTIRKAGLAASNANLALRRSPVRDTDLAPLLAQISLAKIALQIAENERRDTLLLSPIDGVVTFIHGKIGENVSISEAALSSFLTIQADELLVEANIPETDIAKINVGDKVEMTIDAFDFTEKFQGTVVGIDTAETIIQGVVYYQIKTAFNLDDERLKSGMTTNLEIVTAEKEDVIIIPARAINFEDSTRYVQVLRNGAPEKVTITTGLESDQFVEVTSGLEEGDQIITFVR
ncbi:HlyD family efflux transporter periplasmic adaptor subunit [Candidatus Peregrinibacteria bacterium]|nr:HlyD family efflux transporter periplasmic adaptor subunit [Candidatus Peregrinibacteria bacterium]